MPVLSSRLGDWELDHVQAWSERDLVIRAEPHRLIDRSTKVATIGSCFAAELAAMMGAVGIQGSMHPGGLYYTTATIRQELERIAGRWPERDHEPLWQVDGGWIDPFRAYTQSYPDQAALLQDRQKADEAADSLFRNARVVVVTLGLIEAWRGSTNGNNFRQIPHPAVFREIAPEFHRLTVAEMRDDLERIRRVVRDDIGAELVVTTSPVPLHSTFTGLDVRVANSESKSRIRAAVSEFVEAHPDVHYFHSYEMVVTAEKQSDYFREDGRHVHRHAVEYIISEFVRLYAEESLRMPDADHAWLTPITQKARTVEPQRKANHAKEPRPRASLRRRLLRQLRRRAGLTGTRSETH